MNRKAERHLMIVGAVGLIIISAVGGLFVWALSHANPTTLRWWAGIATVALPITGALAYSLGRLASKERIMGLETGVQKVMAAAQQTADLRVRMVQQARQKPQPQTPAVQVFIPGGLPPAGGPVVLPPSPRSDEVVEV
jgi:hypothetical protein